MSRLRNAYLFENSTQIFCSKGTVAVRNHSTKSSGKQGTSSSSYHQQHQYPSTSQQQQAAGFATYNPAKPAKSWDNLTTKAFGGYGFGYGYLDTTSVKTGSGGKTGHSRTHSTKVISNVEQNCNFKNAANASVDADLLLNSGKINIFRRQFLG